MSYPNRSKRSNYNRPYPSKSSYGSRLGKGSNKQFKSRIDANLDNNKMNTQKINPKNLHNYHAETKDQYAWIELEFEVEDANGDKYAKDFVVENTPEGLALICPDCGEIIQSNGTGEYACANGHLAYTITNPEIDSDINDSFRNAVEASEASE